MTFLSFCNLSTIPLKSIHCGLFFPSLTWSIVQSHQSPPRTLRIPIPLPSLITGRPTYTSTYTLSHFIATCFVLVTSPGNIPEQDLGLTETTGFSATRFTLVFHAGAYLGLTPLGSLLVYTAHPKRGSCLYTPAAPDGRGCSRLSSSR